MTARLDARSLTYGYAGGGGLSGVSLRLGRGERLALLGANGAGKTTLLLQLSGLVRPHAGTVLVDGQEMGYTAHARAAWHCAVGLLFQDPDDQLFGPTVAEDVAIGPRNRGLAPDLAQQRALDVLGRLGLAHLAHEQVHELSYGQKRAVAMAGVLAQQPRVLLLDEPTLGLDATAQDDLLATLDRLCETGVAVLMATHDVDLASTWADRVAILQHGRLVAHGPAEAVLTDARLDAARLRRPWVLDVARELERAGLLHRGERPPRSAHELVTRLRELPTLLAQVH